MGLTWPLTGRVQEMRIIEAALSDPASAGTVICGTAGIGKSRIAREALAAAAASGCRTHWAVGASCAQTLPLGAFSTWIPADGADPAHLVRGVVEALTAAQPGTPVVVGVDDAHLLDDLSTFVLHQLVQRSAAKVVLTVRDGEQIPAGTQELWNAGEFTRLDLQPLTREDTTALLSNALGGAVDTHAANRLWNLAHGNVLYLRHIVAQEFAQGRLENRYGLWQWLGDPTMPCCLVELVESRIGALSDAVGTVVDALAVGEPIPLSALHRIAGHQAVEDADTRGLIALDPRTNGIAVRLAHPLYGEVRRKHGAPTKLRRMRGLVATELATAGDHDDIQVVIRRATLSIESDIPPDVALLTNAAHGAIWLADLTLADRLADAAVRAGAGHEARLLRAHALSWLGRGDEAEAVLAGMPVSHLTDGDYARLTYLRASNMLWALAEPARAKEIIDEASHRTPDQSRGWIDALRTVYWFAMDRPDLAASAAHHLTLDTLPPIVGTEVAWVLTAMSADAGRTAEAVAMAETGYAVAARGLDPPQMRFNVADAHLSALLLAGHVEDALDIAELVRQQAVDLPGAAQSLGAAIAGRAALGAGRLDTACKLLESATAALSSLGHATGWGYRYHIPFTTTLAMRGDVDKAASALDALESMRRPFRSLDYERALARAWVTAGHGALSEAITMLRAAAETASRDGLFAAEVICLQTALQFGDRSTAPRLSELENIVDGPRVGLAARFAAALCDHDPIELASTSKDFETMGDLVAAADASAHAAIAYRRQDLRGSALASIARAEALSAHGGGVDTPALRHARQPLPLTDREREIVMLLSEGMSNREVAERLTLSARTVEGHIYKAMTKTGTVSRDELAALLPKRVPRSVEWR